MVCNPIIFLFNSILYSTSFSLQADDPDTTKRITYELKQGDTELFEIDQKTGVIKTIRGLDYEKEKQHILIVGTLENTSDLAGSTTRVIVNVQVNFISLKLESLLSSRLVFNLSN